MPSRESDNRAQCGGWTPSARIRGARPSASLRFEPRSELVAVAPVATFARIMDLATLANLGEFIGGLVVMVSLVYLAHQVRQNTLSLRTENYARVLDRMSSIQAQIATDGDLNQGQAGTLPDDVWERWKATIVWWLSFR